MPKPACPPRLPAATLQVFLARSVEALQSAAPPAWVVWGLVLAAALFFAAGLGFPLVFGDFALLEPKRLERYSATWPIPGGQWLSDALFHAWSKLVGRDWLWHRALNIAIHVAAVGFVFAIGRRLLSRDTGAGVHPGWIAWLAAALFALHPLVVYPVAYLSARPVLLHGLFALVAVWSVLRAAGETWRGSWWLGPLACIGAVLTSPAGMGVPLAMAAALISTGGRLRRGPATVALALSLVVAAIGLIWGHAAGTAAPAGSDYFGSVADNAWRWLRALGLALVPVTAVVGIDMPEPEPVVSAWLAFASLGAFAAVAVLAVRALRHPRYAPVGTALAVLLALALPELFHPGAWTAFAPWRGYPWIAFLCLAAATVVAHLAPRPALAVAAAAIAAAAVLAAATLSTFSTHVRVWDQAIRASQRLGERPQDARLYVNRATVHRAEGHAPAAIADYDKALALQPDLPRALRGRAQAYIDDTRYGAALRDLERLLVVDPAQAVTHADIGLVHMQMGRLPEAMKAFDTAIAKGAREPKVFLNRGIARFELGGTGAAPRALDDIERALSLDADYALAHFNRGLIFEQAAEAGVRLRDAVSPDIMRIVGARNIARACELGHRPACNLEREREERKTRAAPQVGDAPYTLTPDQLRRQGLPVAR